MLESAIIHIIGFTLTMLCWAVGIVAFLAVLGIVKIGITALFG